MYNEKGKININLFKHKHLLFQMKEVILILMNKNNQSLI